METLAVAEARRAVDLGYAIVVGQRIAEAPVAVLVAVRRRTAREAVGVLSRAPVAGGDRNRAAVVALALTRDGGAARAQADALGDLALAALADQLAMAVRLTGQLLACNSSISRSVDQ